VQAYCARAGNVADRMSKPTINASERLNSFMAVYRIDLFIELFIDIVLAQPRSLPGRLADVHYHSKDAKD
jgi:hypothetical protein